MKRNPPYYLISYKMDSNDGDYMKDACQIPESEWKSLHPVFFLALLYLGNGYSGKFSLVITGEITMGVILR